MPRPGRGGASSPRGHGHGSSRGPQPTRSRSQTLGRCRDLTPGGERDGPASPRRSILVASLRSSMWPACRPITSTTITLSWLSAVVCSRSMASTQICTAVSKPKVKLGGGQVVVDRLRYPHHRHALAGQAVRHTQGVLTTDRNERIHLVLGEHGPHLIGTTVHLVGVGARRAEDGADRAATCLAAGRPRGAPPGSRARPSTRRGSPRSRRRRTRSPLRATARITAFNPGQSPPPVSMATFTCARPCALLLVSASDTRAEPNSQWSSPSVKPAPIDRPLGCRPDVRRGHLRCRDRVARLSAPPEHLAEHPAGAHAGVHPGDSSSSWPG